MPSGRIGLFGGSFNPPHVAHLAVAEAACEQAGLDRVLWVPAATSPFKQGEAMPSAAHRLAMTRLAVAGNDAFEVSDIEVERAGVSYTVETARALQEAHPEVDFRLIIGGDSLAGFAGWHRAEEIAERVQLVVYHRPGWEVGVLPPYLAGRVAFVDAPPIDLSSTAVRAHLRAGRSARYLVPDAVLAYIDEHGLYR